MFAFSQAMSAQSAQLAEDQFKPAKSTVLIVEDEEYARRALCQLLEHCGYRTEAAGSAEEAVIFLKAACRGSARMPDLAVIDFHLPGSNGLELIRTIKRLRPGLVPVLLTAAEEIEVGFDDPPCKLTYLHKPIEFESLLRVLSNTLHKALVK